MNLNLRSILESNKLTGPNFFDWLRNTKIILRSKKILYVLDEAAPELPLSDAPMPNIKKDVDKKKYHFCSKEGHWKRNCRAYLAGLKKKKHTDALTSGTYMIEIYSSITSYST